MNSRLKKIVAGGAAILAAGTALFYQQTTTVTVKWRPTAGDSYRLYYGKASGQYPNSVGAGTTGSRSISLRRKTTYYFALSAVRNQRESRKSKEVRYTTR